MMLTRIFTDYRAGAITSLFSAGASEAAAAMSQNNEMQFVQGIAAIVAIVAGLVAIVNGCDTFIRRHHRVKIKTDEETD